MNKSTYGWISFFSLWLVVLTHSSGGPAVMFGEFIGSFIFIYACVWIMSKVKSVLNRVLKKPT